MSGFPQHIENVKVARCSGCGGVATLVGHWGERQERKLCKRCDDAAWARLLAKTGRLAEWTGYFR
jgi:hypothetical protein